MNSDVHQDDGRLSEAGSNEDVQEYGRRRRLIIEATRSFVRSGWIQPQYRQHRGLAPFSDFWNDSGLFNAYNGALAREVQNEVEGWQEAFSQDTTLVNSEDEGEYETYANWAMNENGIPPLIDFDQIENSSGSDWTLPSNPPASEEDGEPTEEERELFHQIEGALHRENESQETVTNGFGNPQTWELDEFDGVLREGVDIQESANFGIAHDEAGQQWMADSLGLLQNGNQSADTGFRQSFSGQDVVSDGDPHQITNNVERFHDDNQHQATRATEYPLRDWFQRRQAPNIEHQRDENGRRGPNNQETIPHSNGILPQTDAFQNQSPAMGNNGRSTARDLPIRTGPLFHMRPSDDDDVFGEVVGQGPTSNIQTTEHEYRSDSTPLVGEEDNINLNDPTLVSAEFASDEPTLVGDGLPSDSNTFASENQPQSHSQTTVGDLEDLELPSVVDNGLSNEQQFPSGSRRRLTNNSSRTYEDFPFQNQSVPSNRVTRTFFGRAMTDENGYVPASHPFHAPGGVYSDPIDWDEDHGRMVRHTFQTYHAYTSPEAGARYPGADKENIAPPIQATPVNTRSASPNRYEVQNGRSRERRPHSFGPLRPMPTLMRHNTYAPETTARNIWYRRPGRDIQDLPEERSAVTDDVRPVDEPGAQFEEGSE